jgi:dihydropteroate synthase
MIWDVTLREVAVLALGDPVPDGVADAGTSPPVSRLGELLAGGDPVLVSIEVSPDTEVSSDEDEAALLAAVSVYAWLGVGVFRVPARHRRSVRQALDMVASIKGTRQPTLSRRGLA